MYIWHRSSNSFMFSLQCVSMWLFSAFPSLWLLNSDICQPKRPTCLPNFVLIRIQVASFSATCWLDYASEFNIQHSTFHSLRSGKKVDQSPAKTIYANSSFVIGVTFLFSPPLCPLQHRRTLAVLSQTAISVTAHSWHLTTCSKSYFRCITKATNYAIIFILSLWFVVNWQTELQSPFSNASVEKWIF